TVHCRTIVGHAVPPHLKCAELCDAVLYVIERVLKDVELAIPPRSTLGLQSAPVNIRLEPAANLQPRAVALVPVVSLAAGVDPALECIHARDVRKREHDILQVLHERT